MAWTLTNVPKRHASVSHCLVRQVFRSGRASLSHGVVREVDFDSMYLWLCLIRLPVGLPCYWLVRVDLLVPATDLPVGSCNLVHVPCLVVCVFRCFPRYWIYPDNCAHDSYDTLAMLPCQLPSDPPPKRELLDLHSGLTPNPAAQRTAGRLAWGNVLHGCFCSNLKGSGCKDVHCDKL